MEGTNRPFLKAPASGTLSVPPLPRAAESSRGGRVENRDPEKEGLGRMEGVPAAPVVWRCPSGGTPSFQAGPPRPHGPGKGPGPSAQPGTLLSGPLPPAAPRRPGP